MEKSLSNESIFQPPGFLVKVVVVITLFTNCSLKELWVPFLTSDYKYILKYVVKYLFIVAFACAFNMFLLHKLPITMRFYIFSTITFN